MVKKRKAKKTKIKRKRTAKKNKPERAPDEGTWRKPRTIKQHVALYSSAYRIAWKQISPLRKREQPDLSLRLRASIGRQIGEGATDPLSIAFEALGDI